MCRRFTFSATFVCLQFFTYPEHFVDVVIAGIMFVIAVAEPEDEAIDRNPEYLLKEIVRSNDI